VQQAEQLLQTGSDWALSGVLERSISHARQQPDAYLPGQAWADAAADWSLAASLEQRQSCAVPADEEALWHVRAGWAQPAQLVSAWLRQAGVHWRGNSAVQQIRWQADTPHWQVLDAQGHSLAQADLVVIAAGPASAALLAASGAPPVVLRPMRGQVSWGWHAVAPEPLAGLKNSAAFPAFPVNGHGNFIPAVPLAGPNGQTAWLAGASFERNNPLPQYRAEDSAYNLERLHTLLPAAAAALQADFATEQVQSWSGVRAVTPSHLPLVGPVPARAPGLWLCTGLGARGLSLAALCAELLAARLHGEPLPVERQLADALLPYPNSQ
jgi:tRNA 5-methylaminomethyl-2-thiouridine biosynthesis bifunctional protein